MMENFIKIIMGNGRIAVKPTNRCMPYGIIQQQQVKLQEMEKYILENFITLQI